MSDKTGVATTDEHSVVRVSCHSTKSSTVSSTIAVHVAVSSAPSSVMRASHRVVPPLLMYIGPLDWVVVTA